MAALPVFPPPSNRAELAAQQFVSAHWNSISYITGYSAPYRDLRAFTLPQIQQYSHQLLTALAHPKCKDHVMFRQEVELLLAKKDFADRHLISPSGALHSLLPKDFNPQTSCLFALADSAWTRCRAAVLQHSSFLELHLVYRDFLSSRMRCGNNAWNAFQQFDGENKETFLEQIAAYDDDTEDVPIAVANDQGRRIPYRLTTLIGSLDRVVRDVFELPAQPPPSSRRWPRAHSNNSEDNNSQQDPSSSTGSPVLRNEEEFQQPTQQQQQPLNPPSTSMEVNVHAKSRQLQVAWLAPIYVTPFLKPKHAHTCDDVEALYHLARIGETPARIKHCLRVLRSSNVWRLFRLFASLDAESVLPKLRAARKETQVLLGTMRCEEGALYEQHVWDDSVPLIEEQIVLPRFFDSTASFDIGFVRGWGESRRSSSSIATTTTTATQPSSFWGNYSPLQWIRKCQAMALTDEELRATLQHPMFDAERNACLTSLTPQKGDNSDAVESYLRFRVFATHIMCMPFFHFVDQRSLLLYERIPPHPAKASAEERAQGWQWKSVSELDGLLLDLRDNTVLCAFEIKANPADLGKALKQRDRLGKMMERVGKGEAVQTQGGLMSAEMKKAHAAAAGAKRRMPKQPTTAAPMTTTSGGEMTGNATSSNNAEEENRDGMPEDVSRAPPPPSLPAASTVGPRYDLQVMPPLPFRRPFYQFVFPLTSANFSPFFIDEASVAQHWISITKLPEQQPSSSASSSSSGVRQKGNHNAIQNNQNAPLVGGVVPPYMFPSTGSTRHMVVEGVATLFVDQLTLLDPQVGYNPAAFQPLPPPSHPRPTAPSATTTAAAEDSFGFIRAPRYQLQHARIVQDLLRFKPDRMVALKCMRSIGGRMQRKSSSGDGASRSALEVFRDLLAKQALSSIVWLQSTGREEE